MEKNTNNQFVFIGSLHKFFSGQTLNKKDIGVAFWNIVEKKMFLSTTLEKIVSFISLKDLVQNVDNIYYLQYSNDVQISYLKNETNIHEHFIKIESLKIKTKDNEYKQKDYATQILANIQQKDLHNEKIIDNYTLFGNINEFKTFEYKQNDKQGCVVKCNIEQRYYQIQMLSYDNKLSKKKTDELLQEKTFTKFFKENNLCILFNVKINNKNSLQAIWGNDSLLLKFRCHYSNTLLTIDFENTVNYNNVYQIIKKPLTFEHLKQTLSHTQLGVQYFDEKCSVTFGKNFSLGYSLHNCYHEYTDTLKIVKTPLDKECYLCEFDIDQLLSDKDENGLKIVYGLDAHIHLNQYDMIKCFIKNINNIVKIFEFFELNYNAVNIKEGILNNDVYLDLSDMFGKTITFKCMVTCNKNIILEGGQKMYLSIDKISNIQNVENLFKDNPFDNKFDVDSDDSEKNENTDDDEPPKKKRKVQLELTFADD